MDMPLYAKDIMSTHVVTLHEEMLCSEALNVFMLNKFTGAPVINQDGRIVGVVSLTDLLESNIHAPFGVDFFTHGLVEYMEKNIQTAVQSRPGKVKNYVSQNLYTASPETPVNELAALMYRRQIHRLIIVDTQSNELKGLVTTFDLIKVLATVDLTAQLAATGT